MANKSTCKPWMNLGGFERFELKQLTSKTCKNILNYIKETRSFLKFFKAHNQVTIPFFYKKNEILKGNTLTLPQNGGNRFSEDFKFNIFRGRMP